MDAFVYVILTPAKAGGRISTRMPSSWEILRFAQNDIVTLIVNHTPFFSSAILCASVVVFIFVLQRLIPEVR